MARHDDAWQPGRRALLTAMMAAPLLAAGGMTRQAVGGMGNGMGMGIGMSAGHGGPVGERTSGLPAMTACERAIDALELGVIPGAGDQTPALAAALRRAAELGRALRLPPGDVVVGELELDVPVRLFGHVDGRLVCRGGARRLLTVRGTDACLLAGVRIEGGGQRPSAEEGLVLLQDVGRAQVVDCVIEGTGGHGLRLERCGGVLSGNHLRHVAESAVFALDCQALEIIRNDIAHCGNGGILVWQSEKRDDGALVAHNRIRHIRADAGGTGQNGNGVNVFRAAGVRVVENDIAECAYSAVRDNSGDDVVIARNRCRRLGEVAIFVEFSFVNAQVANNLVEGAVSGISITNMKEGGRRAVVSGNIVRDLRPKRGLPGEEGYGIAAEAETTVVGNVVERAAVCGIALGWGKYLRNVVASGNIVRESPVGVAVSVVKGVGAATIAANVFERVKLAVAGFDHAKRVTGELLGARRLPGHVVLNANSRR